jgi:hypothetical protein
LFSSEIGIEAKGDLKPSEAVLSSLLNSFLDAVWVDRSSDLSGWPDTNSRESAGREDASREELIVLIEEEIQGEESKESEDLKDSLLISELNEEELCRCSDAFFEGATIEEVIVALEEDCLLQISESQTVKECARKMDEAIKDLRSELPLLVDDSSKALQYARRTFRNSQEDFREWRLGAMGDLENDRESSDVDLERHISHRRSLLLYDESQNFFDIARSWNSDPQDLPALNLLVHKMLLMDERMLKFAREYRKIQRQEQERATSGEIETTASTRMRREVVRSITSFVNGVVSQYMPGLDVVDFDAVPPQNAILRQEGQAPVWRYLNRLLTQAGLLHSSERKILAAMYDRIGRIEEDKVKASQRIQESLKAISQEFEAASKFAEAHRMPLEFEAGGPLLPLREVYRNQAVNAMRVSYDEQLWDAAERVKPFIVSDPNEEELLKDYFEYLKMLGGKRKTSHFENLCYFLQSELAQYFEGAPKIPMGGDLETPLLPRLYEVLSSYARHGEPSYESAVRPLMHHLREAVGDIRKNKRYHTNVRFLVGDLIAEAETLVKFGQFGEKLLARHRERGLSRSSDHEEIVDELSKMRYSVIYEEESDKDTLRQMLKERIHLAVENPSSPLFVENEEQRRDDELLFEDYFKAILSYREKLQGRVRVRVFREEDEKDQEDEKNQKGEEG